MTGQPDPALVWLLRVSHHLSPDDLAATAADATAMLGAGDTVAYLADHGQRLLVPLPGRNVPPRQSLEIDTTLAGRAYRTAQRLCTGDGPWQVWIPLMNGATRLGVLEVHVDRLDEAVLHTLQDLAGVVARLVLVKGLYGDVFTIARRQQRLTLSAEMQWNLLPPLTFSNGQVVVSGLLKPSYRIAGDMFDYACNGHAVHIAIFDAMGHGFQATMMATAAVGAYRHSRRAGLDLAGTYAAMDDVIATQFGHDGFVTAQLGQLNSASGRLRWLNAGHPAPMLLRDRALDEPRHCEPSLPLGLGSDVAEIVEEQLQPGDRLLFYTDGVTDARSVAGEFFGEERLGDWLVRSDADGLSAPETLRRLGHAILDHQDGRLEDDATGVLVEWRGPSPAAQPM